MSPLRVLHAISTGLGRLVASFKVIEPTWALFHGQIYCGTLERVPYPCHPLKMLHPWVFFCETTIILIALIIIMLCNTQVHNITFVLCRDLKTDLHAHMQISIYSTCHFAVFNSLECLYNYYSTVYVCILCILHAHYSLVLYVYSSRNLCYCFC